MRCTQKHIKYAILIVVSITIGYYIYLSYQRTEANFKKNITACFHEATDYDLTLRTEKFGGGNRTKNIPPKKYKHIDIITEKGKETFHFKDSLDEDLIYELTRQYMLAKLAPINPNSFDSIFNSKLKKQGLEINTAIAYTYKDVTQYSHKDFKLMAEAFRTPSDTLDIKKEVIVQGFAEINFGVILKQMEVNLFLLVGIWLGSLIAVWYILRPDKNENKKVKEAEIQPIVTDPNIMVLKNIRINIATETLYIHGEEKKIYQSDYELLYMFLSKPDHTLTRKEIIDRFWNDNEECDNRINTVISRLRTILKEDSGVELVNKRKLGYSLEDLP